jgi:hypothetical protein
LVRTTTLLWPYERPARSALAPWAAALATRLATRGSPPETAKWLNQAALVFSHLGASGVARWVCHEQIDLFGRSALSDRGLLVLALQPSINLGRLDVLAGRRADGREQFRLAEHLRAREAVNLAGRLRVQPGDWEFMIAFDPTIEATLTTVYVIDSVQSWLSESGHREILALTDRVGAWHGPVPWTAIYEARVACLAELGDLDRAIAEAGQVQNADANLVLAFQLHLSHGLWTAGLRRDAEELVSRVGARLVHTDWGRHGTAELPRYFPLIETAVRLARNQQLESLAARLACTLLEVATQAGDEVMTLKALRILCCLQTGPTSSRWESRAAALELASDYRLVRHGTGGPARPVSAENMRQYRGLAAAVGEATGADGIPDLDAALGA